MDKKKILIGVFILLLLISFILLFFNRENLSSKEKISGQIQGERGIIKLDIVVRDNKIKHIEILDHSETPGYDRAMVMLSDDIVAKNSLDVEYISGATITSRDFLKAVRQILENNNVNISKLEKIEDTSINYSKDVDNHDYDVVIIGGGGAGFTSAIEAITEDPRARVVVIEKMSFGGGNTRMSGGEYAAAGNWVQLKEGIDKDSKEIFFQDVYKGGGEVGNKSLIKILVDNALDNAYWLRDYVGVEFKENQSWYAGHKYHRSLWPKGDGPEYIDTLIKKAEDLGVKIDYNTKAEELILNENNEIIGVRASKGGRIVKYFAQRGVIITTGGFGANVEMRQKYNTMWSSLDEKVPTTNSPAITGDGIIMASNIGANLIDMEYIQLYPVNNPATGNYYFIDYARLNSNALLLNQDGKRFVDEKETRENLSEAMLSQPYAKAYELIDSKVAKEMDLENIYKNELEKCFEQGVLVKGSLKECSDYFKLPYEEVEKSIKRYNLFAENKKDLDFNRILDLEKIEQGPYLMFSCIVSVHHTMGGIEINENAEVINKDGQIIKGLYAAGEVTGGIHGNNRLGSMSIPDTVTFGRIAGKNCVNRKNNTQN